MFDTATFTAVYSLLEGDQTLDDAGAGVDCGVRCDAFCCRPGNTTKYLLPGERRFLEEALAPHGGVPFRFVNLGFFESIVEPPASERPCACAPARAFRTFNCRVFPYLPVLSGRDVTAVKKSKAAHLGACWIETPAGPWARRAVDAWQRVLDDDDNRRLFARLGALWEWTERSDRGEAVGSSLAILEQILTANDEELWRRCAAFFAGRV